MESDYPTTTEGHRNVLTSSRDDSLLRRRQAGKRPRRSALLAAATDELVGCGYGPRNDDTGMTLVNCPFHALAQEYTTLVCGMNLELMNGLADGLEVATLVPRLDPAPGRCCVRLGTSIGARTEEKRA